MNPHRDTPAIGPEDLADALRRQADVQPDRAAVDLLIAHRRWLTAPEFLQHVELWNGPDYTTAVVDWVSVERIARHALSPATGSELAVLGAACVIARGPLASVATRCDDTNRALVQAAVDAALTR